VPAVRKLLAEPKAVAVGEIGLDYYRMHSPRAEQLSVFERMLDLARETTLPVIVHCREAGDDVLARLRSWSLRCRTAFGGRPLGVLHYFSGTPGEARTYVELGFKISVHTSVTHPKAYLLRQVVSELRLDDLVIETDSPYGAPQQVRGKRNEPAYVVAAAKAIAEIKGVSSAEAASATAANALSLFRLNAADASELIGARA
jgi:TatD DNase family protein